MEFGRSFSFLNGWFVGSMLIILGCILVLGICITAKTKARTIPGSPKRLYTENRVIIYTTYCWWKKSGQPVVRRNPLKYKSFNHQQYHPSQTEPERSHRQDECSKGAEAIWFVFHDFLVLLHLFVRRSCTKNGGRKMVDLLLKFIGKMLVMLGWGPLAV